MSNKAEVAVSYDVDNEFFRLWLDEKMAYTCGLFEGTDSLEQAQLNKHEFLANYAKVTPESVVLDIGCGWGACLDYLATRRNVRQAHGITLSEAQFKEIQRRNVPNVTAQCVSYLDYKPTQKFDGVISICMMEHIATPQEVRAGQHIEKYREYFRLAHSWTRPGAHFALQTILRNRVPRDRNDLRDIGWVTYAIFPGGLSLRLEDICEAVNPYWEIMEVKTRREHYRRTTFEWRERLRKNEKLIRERWGNQVYEDYDRYLSTCVRGFEMQYQSLAQWQLRRNDDVDSSRS